MSETEPPVEPPVEPPPEEPPEDPAVVAEREKVAEALQVDPRVSHIAMTEEEEAEAAAKPPPDDPPMRY